MTPAPGTGPPALDDLLAAAHVVSIPLRVRFRGVDTREALLLHGPRGWGEFSPFVEYDDAESARWLASALEAAWEGPPPAVRDSVPVNATVPAVAAERVEAVLARFPGCSTAKVKVAEAGQSLDDDVSRVAAVRDVLSGRQGSGCRIRVDANGGWSVDDALRALPVLRSAAGGGPGSVGCELEYAEQPCASVADLVAVRTGLARAGVDVRVAADESVRKAEDPLAVALAGAADVVVVKVAPLGGVRAAARVARVLGEDHGVPVVVSSALDTSVGIAAGVALAASLPELPYACGLATVGLLTQDVSADPLVAVDGALAVRRVEADPGQLARLAAPQDRRRWWLDRLRRCHGLLSTPASRA